MNYILLLILLSSIHGRATDAYAQKWFEGYNETYFDGKLSKTQVHFVHNLRDEEGRRLMGETFMDTPNRMLLDDEFADDRAVWGEVILHESCHIALSDRHVEEFDQHGEQWQQCMTRLASAGAMRDLW